MTPSRPRLSTLLGIGAAILAGAAAIPSGAVAAIPSTYSVTQIPRLNGTTAVPAALNGDGDVVGRSANAPFIWRNGQTVRLADVFGWAYDVNDSDQAIFKDTSGNNYLYSPGSTQEIADPSGGDAYSPSSINDSGTVAASETFEGHAHPVKWNGSWGAPMDVLTGYPDGFTEDINSTGAVAGYSKSEGSSPTLTRATVWSASGQPTDLGTLPLGTSSYAYGLNDLGDVAGVSYNGDGDPSAVLWHDGHPQDLGDGACAVAVNNFTQVLADGCNGGAHPFIWDNGQKADVQDLLPDDSVWTIEAVYDINDDGQIAALAYGNGIGEEGVLLTPSADVSPPDAPADLTAAGEDRRADLAWHNPTGDSTFRRVRILRSTAGYATDPDPDADHELAYEGSDESYSDQDVVNGTHYFYSAFSEDTSNNWSGAANVDVTPAIPSVDPGAQADGLIAYTGEGPDGEAEIFTMNSDGGSPTQITHDGGDASHTSGAPVWSPDHTKIAFIRGGPGATGGIYVMNADGSGEHEVVGDQMVTNDQPVGAVDSPTWSPDGTRLAFTRTFTALVNGVYRSNIGIGIVDVDGTNEHQVTGSTPTATNYQRFDVEPSWSPAFPRSPQGKIAFARGNPQASVIAVMDPDGSHLKLNEQPDDPSGASYDHNPTWSPDGTDLAYSHAGYQAPPDLYVMRADGSNARRLTDTGDQVEDRPSFSPTGTRIAFEHSLNYGNGDIESMPASGGAVQNLTATADLDEVDPSWSSATNAIGGGGGDSSPPETTITGGPAGPTNDSTPAFELSASETGATFACKMDGGAFVPCGTPQNVNGETHATFTSATLADGAHTLSVAATDAAGNVDPTPAMRDFTVDTEAPVVTITGGPTSGNAPTFEFSASEPGAVFECAVDGGGIQGCGTPQTTGGETHAGHTVAPLAAGSHTFAVQAVDLAGNWSAAATRTFDVLSPDQPGTDQPSTGQPPTDQPETPGDTTPPETTIVKHPPTVTRSRTSTWEFASNESPVTFKCVLDDKAISCKAAGKLTAAWGFHTLEVAAVDGAGNVDRSPASWSWQAKRRHVHHHHQHHHH